MTGTGPVLRYDITTNDWVLFAPARARRPHARAIPPRADDAKSRCPFCPGNEHLTPGEILRVDDASKAGWSVRVVPNKFPALEPGASSEQTEIGPVFREMGGYGVHEIVIESPDHFCPLADQRIEQIEGVMRVLHSRFTSLMADPRLRTIIVFKNHGEAAGTSLAHPHWQIIATPVVPRLLRIKHAVATEYFDRAGRCVYRVLLEAELASRSRVLAENEHYAAVLPYASALAFQIRILPRVHHASFGRTPVQLLRPLAEILKSVLTKLSALLDDPAFNLTIDTAPLGDEEEPYFLWHIDILPRLTTPAGFELGSGMPINPMLPEEATRRLRGEPANATVGKGPP
jgi:UDPglucose--hexose-1-phosphate uridylyltransferase